MNAIELYFAVAIERARIGFEAEPAVVPVCCTLAVDELPSGGAAKRRAQDGEHAGVGGLLLSEPLEVFVLR